MAPETQPVTPATGRETRRAAPTSASASATVAAKRPASGARWIVPAKIAVFIAAWYPLARIVLFGMTDRLGANPIEFITRSTGLWTLVFLCITLSVTPLRPVVF